jgi:hypothetical protein
MSEIELLGFDGPDYRVRLAGTGREALVPAALIASEVGSSERAAVEEWLSALQTELADALHGTDAGPFTSLKIVGS